MAQSSRYDLKGLHTNNSNISGVPEGSLSIALNLDLSQLNLAQCRRGFNTRFGDLSDSTYRATKLFDYAGYLYAYYNTSLNYYNSGWNTNGSITKPANALAIRPVSMNQNLYVTSSTGLKKIDSYSGTLYQTGIPGGLMLTLTEDTSGTGTAVGANKYVAYRYFIGRYDANNNFIRGGVSSREIFSNDTYRAYSFATTDVNTATDVITLTGHTLADGTAIQFTTTGTLPTGLSLATTYYVVSSVASTSIKVAATAGGAAIDITAVGSGTHTATATALIARNIFVQGYLPSGIDSTYLVQVYRSADSSTSTISDELGLVYELPIYNQFFSTYTKTFAPGDVNTGNEMISITSHGFLDGMVVRFSTTTTLPTGLSANTDYYIISANTNDFKVSATFGGSAIDISTTGSGTHTVYGANQFAFKDITPETLLTGTTIYTAASQQGISNNNYEPPLAADIALYKQYLFYADVSSKYRLNFTLISVSDGTNGELANGHTITISDGSTTEVYTANSTAANVSTKNFKIDIVSASLSTRIDTTIRSFVSVVNQASALVYAYLSSTGDTDLPGKCLLESRALGGTAFYLLSSRQKAFNPQLTTAATTNTTSTNDAFRNGLMFSKQGEPEAVPIKNVFKVGSSDDPIKRIIPLRDSLLIFKAKDGVYILRGDNESSFSVTLLDSTAKIVAPESIVVLNSLVYGLFEAGISAVSDTGVDVVSDSVADKIQTLYGTCLQQVKDYAFATAYQTEGHYILALPQTSSDTYCTYQLIYNVFNENFWEWDLSVGAGHVSSTDNKLYFGRGDKNRVVQEYKTYSYTDFADYEQSSTLSSYLTTTLTISGINEMSVGDILQQTGSQPAYITAVDTSLGTVVVDLSQTWDTGNPVYHYKAINNEIEWNPDFAGNPAGLKHYSACNLLFNQNIIQTATMSFSSDTNPGVNTISISGPDAIGAWGYVAWDDGVWGGESSPAPTRIGVPRPNARCNSLTVKFSHSVAQSDWRLVGLSLEFNPTSTRTTR